MRQFCKNMIKAIRQFSWYHWGVFLPYPLSLIHIPYGGYVAAVVKDVPYTWQDMYYYLCMRLFVFFVSITLYFSDRQSDIRYFYIVIGFCSFWKIIDEFSQPFHYNTWEIMSVAMGILSAYRIWQKRQTLSVTSYGNS